jgi:hypothetical protein
MTCLVSLPLMPSKCDDMSSFLAAELHSLHAPWNFHPRDRGISALNSEEHDMRWSRSCRLRRTQAPSLCLPKP